MVLYEHVRLMDPWVDSLDNVMFGSAHASSPRLVLVVVVVVGVVLVAIVVLVVVLV